MNIAKSVLSFPVVFEKKDDFEVDDTRFTRVQIRLMHLGENLNASYFDKEVVDNAIPSLAYIPIVGFIEENQSGEEDFSDHRYVLVRTENGLERQYKGSAYGVILSSEENNAHYEDIVCEDGETRTFLMVDGICWNMFEDSASILQENMSRPQSMELQPDSIWGYEDENGIFHFTDFSFRASCILGEDFQPAMLDSKIEIDFSVNGFVEAIQSEIKNKYESFAKILERGGKSEMDSKKKLEDETLVAEDIVDEVIEDIEEQTEEVEEPVVAEDEVVEEPVEEPEEVEDVEEDTEDESGEEGADADASDDASDDSADTFEANDDVANDDTDTDYALTHRGLESEICEILDGITFTDEDGYVCWKYWYQDIQENEVIVFDAEMGWHLYGIPFEMKGDVPELKFEFAKRKKVSYEDYEIVEETEPDSVFAQRMKNYVSKETYDSLKEEYDDIKAKNDEFAKAEQERIDAIESAKKDDELAKYEIALADCDEFEQLKADKDTYSFEEIESKCAIMYAHKTIETKNDKKNRTAKARLAFEADNGDSNLVHHTKYGNIIVSK